MRNIIATSKFRISEYTILIVCTFKYDTFKKNRFLFFSFLIKKGTGLDGSRWSILIRIYMQFQINRFLLIPNNLPLKSYNIINGITGYYFCREISSKYSKHFWGNIRIIPLIYKCEAFSYTFKFITKLWIFNKFFITVSRNIVNPEKISFCARTELLIGIMF